MTILDANVFIALLSEQDALHERAMQVVEQVSAPILLPEYIFVEILTVLAMRAGMPKVEKFLSAVVALPITFLPSSGELLAHSLIMFRKQPGGRLSFPDAALLYLSREHDIITFDKTLERAITGKKRKQ